MLYPLIDIGSATIRMAIYDIVNNSLKLIHKRKHTVGLAAYVKDGIMQPEGIAKATEILLDFKDFLSCLPMEKPVAFTTAALRNCSNSAQAVATISANTGIPLHVISGDKEAWYDFIAITHGLNYHEGCIMDIGGASTELIHFTNREIQAKISLPIGSLALHTKFCQNTFPREAELKAMREYIRQYHVDIQSFHAKGISHICGIGGTFKGTHLLHNLWQEELVEIPLAHLNDMLQHFLTKDNLAQEDVITLLTAVPDRLKTIFPGMVIAYELAHYLGADTITYRDAGMREGFIYAHLLQE